MSRSESASKELDYDLHKSEKRSKWLEAVDDARVKLSCHRKRVRVLTRAIMIFEEKAKAGEPWPEYQKTSEG